MKLRVLAAAAAAAFLLAGCTANDDLAEQYQSGGGQGYISSDGAYVEIPVADRDAPIVFEGVDEYGDTISSETLADQVFVVNFWYAGCPPCRLEAPDLAELSDEYSDSVPFIGVNVTDSADVALAFAEKFSVPYPSIMDAQTASVQLAFAGAVAPNAVPTTIVVDREGRVAARISGRLTDQSILATMIDTVVAEAK